MKIAVDITSQQWDYPPMGKVEECYLAPWLKPVSNLGRNLTIYESVVQVALAAKHVVKTAAKEPSQRPSGFAGNLTRAVANIQRTLTTAQSLLTKDFGKEEAVTQQQKACRRYVFLGFTGNKSAAVPNEKQEKLYSSAKALEQYANILQDMQKESKRREDLNDVQVVVTKVGPPIQLGVRSISEITLTSSVEASKAAESTVVETQENERFGCPFLNSRHRQILTAVALAVVCTAVVFTQL